MFGSIGKVLDKFKPRQFCPECDQDIGADDINIKEGFALCPTCGVLSRLGDINVSGRSNGELLRRPPSGCGIITASQGVTIQVSLRSVTGFLVSCGVAIFWNGIVSVFLLIAFAGLYFNLVGPLPNWFPAPGVKNGQPMMNDAPMELGETLFLCVFLTPFVLFGVGMIVAALINLVGRVDVVVNGADSYVATGVGPFVWKKRFNSDQVEQVSYGKTLWRSEDGTNKVIELTGVETIKFGSLLSEPKMQWIQAALREVLFKPRHEWKSPMLNG